MSDAILQAAEAMVTTLWVYLVLFGIAALDGFLPIVPSETLVITMGVFAAAIGAPHLVLVILAAALGALTGDHISYAIGSTATTLTTGATGFPRRSFTRYAAIAAATWAVYSAGLGYLGGAIFEREPLKGVALGLGLAFAITVLHEAVRFVRHRRAPKGA